MALPSAAPFAAGTGLAYAQISARLSGALTIHPEYPSPMLPSLREITAAQILRLKRRVFGLGKVAGRLSLADQRPRDVPCCRVSVP